MLTVYLVGVSREPESKDLGMALRRGEVRLAEALVTVEEDLRVLQTGEVEDGAALVWTWGIPETVHLLTCCDTQSLIHTKGRGDRSSTTSVTWTTYRHLAACGVDTSECKAPSPQICVSIHFCSQDTHLQTSIYKEQRLATPMSGLHVVP